MKSPLLAIMGPTATGKSDFAISLAKKVNGEIISADSAQIYKELQIITARIPPEEMQGIPHHLMGFLELGKGFSLAEYQKLAYEKITNILNRKKIPILVGGTGLYLRAVLEDYKLSEAPPDQKFRDEMKKRAEIEGKESLYNELRELDIEASKKIHPNNVKRVIRALEVIRNTGKLFSDFSNKGIEHPLNIEPFSFCITYPREILYDRINKRVDIMFRNGAVEEVRVLIQSGYLKILQELKILGCPEIISILEGKCTVEEGSSLLKRNTRRYAKRQLTWFRSQKKLQWVNLYKKEEKEDIESICRLIEEKF